MMSLNKKESKGDRYEWTKKCDKILNDTFREDGHQTMSDSVV